VAQKKVRPVDGMQSPDAVTAQIDTILKDVGKKRGFLSRLLTGG
jgi:hypothetical protein